MYHYVYRITNKVINKHYYGTRSCACLPSEDLGRTYLSSSTDPQFISNQKTHPSDFKYKVVRICVTRAMALQLEIKLHHKFNVGCSTNFYNKVKQTSSGFDTSGIPNTPEQKDHKRKLFTGTGNPFFGRVHTEKTKKLISINHANCNGPANSMYGRTQNDTTKSLISKANTGSSNGRALQINIYNSSGLLMYTCNGTFSAVCRENGLPHGALKKTYHNGGTMENPFKINKAFQGWFARKIEVDE
jgi:hypothetical protein